MKRFFSFICSFILAVSLFAADNATDILDKAAASFKAAGNVKIGFNVSSAQGSTTGYIEISGKKFHCEMGGTKSWYDGKSLWHYVEANKEVTITEPSSAEASRLNPYSFITMYKNGYSCAMGNSTKSYYEVVLTGSGKSAYKTVTVRLDRSSYNPVYIKTVGKSEMEISVNTFLKNRKFSDSLFTFDKKKYKGVDVNDLR